MVRNDHLLNRLNEQYSRMSKSQKHLADYVMEHHEQAVFMTAAKLGQTVGVSESTTVRFASWLGYDGFPEFHRAMEELVMDQLHSGRKIEITDETLPQSAILDTVLQADMDKIRMTLEQTDRNAFDQAVETILKAETIYVVGIRSCAPLASFLGFYLNQIFRQVKLLTTNNASELFEQMIHMSERDVVIGISFPRYSMRTLKAMEFANNRNAKVITLTDSIHSPMNLYSSCNLIAKSELASVMDSLVAPLSLINALILALCMKRSEEVTGTLEELEKVWNEYQVYGNDEMNYLDERIDLNP